MTLTLRELESVVDEFGVSDEQVRRDHAISHLLALIARDLVDDVVFFGGTALARTHLPHGRLSEDLDLLARGPRSVVAAQLDGLLARGAARQLGRFSWEPSLSAVTASGTAHLRQEGGPTIRIQLLPAKDCAPWPTEVRALHQRYEDAPQAALRVPTRASFTAWKTATWADRAAPRDLWDLWDLYQLARTGAVDTAALDLYRRFGPTNRAPAAHLFDHPPTETEWHTALAGQTRLGVTAAAAAAEVARAWAGCAHRDD